jgi:hypothetical protein
MRPGTNVGVAGGGGAAEANDLSTRDTDSRRTVPSAADVGSSRGGSILLSGRSDVRSNGLGARRGTFGAGRGIGRG